MTSYKSELEIGLPYEISIVVRAYMKEKGNVSRKDLESLMDNINQVTRSTTYGIFCALCQEDADKKDEHKENE